jgi:phage-related protein
LPPIEGSGGEKLTMPHSRPMPTIGRRCHELRVTDEDKTWRIVYRIYDDAIVILEVFAKKRSDDAKVRYVRSPRANKLAVTL